MTAIQRAEIETLLRIVRTANRPDLSHLDTQPGAATYVRNANAIDRYLDAKSRILDWGSGAGHMAWLLTRRGHQVFAADFASPLSEFGEGTSFHVLTHPSSLPFQDQTFDVVLSSGTLEHADSINESLREIRRILTKRGRLIVFRFPAEHSLSEWLARRQGRWSHAVRMTKEELRFLLRIHGFRVDKLGYDSFLPIFLGQQFRPLRPIRAALDGVIRGLDAALIRLPLASRYSTSIHCFARVNEEYADELPRGKERAAGQTHQA